MTSVNASKIDRDEKTPPESQLTKTNHPLPGDVDMVTAHRLQLVPSSRYRHPGDVIRLIASGLVLVGTLAAVAADPGQLVGSGTATFLARTDSAERLLIGLVQVAFVLAAVGVVTIVLRYRRFRLLPVCLQAPSQPPARCQESCTWPATNIRTQWR